MIARQGFPIPIACRSQRIQDMQTSKDASPISVLYEDLLWKIFFENTYNGLDHFYAAEVHHSPLTTARHCSQVCRQWRSTLLSSSMIWGRLIHVTALQQTQDDWREEVLSRAGDALLWVFGCVNGETQHGFPLNFVKKNWKRVQNFVVTYTFFAARQVLEQNIWPFMQEPAPQLRRFQVAMPSLSNSVLPLRMFGDDAPHLRQFDIYRLPCKFAANASWLPNLTSVAFSAAFRTEEVLAALQRMPQLISLTIDVIREYHHQGPKVILPNLTTLQTYGDVINSSVILECITPSPNLCLSIQTTSLSFRPQETGKYERYENAITPYILPYFTLYPPSAVALFLNIDVVVLGDIYPRKGHDWEPPRSCRGVLSIAFVPSSLLVKQLISSTCLSHISRLELFTGRRQGYFDGPFDDPFNEAVISALDILSSSVTTLCTDGDTLKQLLRRPLSVTSNLFPSLTTLEVDCRLMTPLAEKEDPHHAFVKLRKAAGRPISVLDLGVLSTNPGNIGYLEEHAGLLVKWKTTDMCAYEYLCGGGHPERLCFRTYQWRKIDGKKVLVEI